MMSKMMIVMMMMMIVMMMMMMMVMMMTTARVGLPRSDGPMYACGMHVLARVVLV